MSRPGSCSRLDIKVVRTRPGEIEAEDPLRSVGSGVFQAKAGG